MTVQQEGRACTTRPSARPHRLRNGDVVSIVPDLILALIVIALGLAIITDPTAGPIDGRHLLAGVAVLTLIIRTTTAAPRR